MLPTPCCSSPPSSRPTSPAPRSLSTAARSCRRETNFELARVRPLRSSRTPSEVPRTDAKLTRYKEPPHADYAGYRSSPWPQTAALYAAQCDADGGPAAWRRCAPREGTGRPSGIQRQLRLLVLGRGGRAGHGQVDVDHGGDLYEAASRRAHQYRLAIQ